MTDLTSLSEVFNGLIAIPHLLMIVGTVAIIAISVAVSAQGSLVLRLIYLFTLAGCVYLLARQLPDINGDFFLNVSTELVGAMAVLIILGNEVSRHRWLIFLIIFIIVGITIPIGLLDEDSQAVGINLSAELVGAFIIFVLLQKREWLWDSSKKVSERERANARKHREKMYRQYENMRAVEREREREKIERAVQADMDRWRVEEAWDIAIKLTATDKIALKRKIRALSATLHDRKVCRFIEDEESQYAECYVLARVGNPPDSLLPPQVKRVSIDDMRDKRNGRFSQVKSLPGAD